MPSTLHSIQLHTDLRSSLFYSLRFFTPASFSSFHALQLQLTNMRFNLLPISALGLTSTLTRPQYFDTTAVAVRGFDITSDVHLTFPEVKERGLIGALVGCIAKLAAKIASKGVKGAAKGRSFASPDVEERSLIESIVSGLAKLGSKIASKGAKSTAKGRAHAALSRLRTLTLRSAGLSGPSSGVFRSSVPR
ncbi:hypothetical protein MVEN_02361200 [Mycena venus]|uniref:Uncharacterized protein n=1 Tax=Mycena venus TaxID=2733690 RepID=A0A8H6X3P7_9AGAR|nr:hypothetical protein MVEN_02361200 [Mycena venus]